MGYIDKLTGLVNAGMIPKENLPALIAAMVSGTKSKTETKVSKNPATRAIVHSRKYRSPASPETVKIRQILNVPIQRRFGLQCATVDSVLWKSDGLVRRLNKDVFNRAIQSPLDEVYTNHAKELSKVAGEKVIYIAKWKVRKMRGNFVRKGVAVPGTHENDGYDWEQASLRSMPSMLQVRPVPSRPGRFVRVKRESPKDAPTAPIDGQTDMFDLTKSNSHSRSAFTRPAIMRADNDVSFISTVRRCGGKCGKSITSEDSFPKTVDWTHNVSTTPYCEKCFTDLGDKCEALSTQTGAVRKRKRPQDDKQSQGPSSPQPKQPSVPEKPTTLTTPPANKRVRCVWLLFIVIYLH